MYIKGFSGFCLYWSNGMFVLVYRYVCSGYSSTKEVILTV